MTSKIFGAAAVAACVALMAGCGGGGGGGGSSGGTSTHTSSGGSTGGSSGSGGSGGSGGSTTPSTDPIAKFMGSYVNTCALDTAAADATTGASLYSKYAISMQVQKSTTKVGMQVIVKFYDAADCSGTERLMLTRQGENDYMNIDNTATIGGLQVAHATSGFGGYFADADGKLRTVSGVALGGTYVVGVSAVKNLAYVDAAGNFYSGDMNQPLDTNGYPTVLKTAPDATKVN